MIHFEQVTKIYAGGQPALERVSFDIQPGEMVYLTGHSGAGKSTLLKLITAIERPTKGTVKVNNRNIGQLSRRQVPSLRRSIGIIFQDHNLLMDRSVHENLALPLVIEGYGEKDIERRVDAALELVGLGDKTNYAPIQLSGGEQQRVGIARAVISRPAILLADEPTGNLDPELSMDILRLFETFNASGTTVLMATHDLGLIARTPYRTLTLQQGRMYSEEAVSE